MNFIRVTRRYQYVFANGTRTRELNLAPGCSTMPIDPPNEQSEEEPRRRAEQRLANRIRAAERKEIARLRREEDAQAQEQLRKDAILAEVNRIIGARIEEIRAEFMNAPPRNGEQEGMEIDDDDDEVVLRIPEPFVYRDIQIFRNVEGKNVMNGKLFDYSRVLYILTIIYEFSFGIL